MADPLATETPDAPRIHRLWATFEDPETERAYLDEAFERTIRPFVRFSVALSVAAFLMYGVHDALVIPEVRSTAWLIRYAYFGPLGLLVVAFALTNKSPRRHQFGMLGFGFAVVSAVCWIGAISPPAGFYIYSGYAVIFVTLGPFLARMSVKSQVVYTVLGALLFDFFDVLVAHSPPAIRFSFNLTMFTLGGMGVLLANQLERQERLAFLQRRVIREQLRAIEAERARSESLLLNVLPRRIADRLLADPGVIADRFDEATVLFSDIVGFTELSSRLPPDELVRRLDAVFSQFDRIADELSLEKIKTIGDAYMVAGGVPAPRADHVVSVCEMALRMRDRLAELAPTLGGELRVRIGVHTGALVGGVIGTKKFIYDVWGDTVNVASRMESHGTPGEIQVSEAVYEVAKDTFDFEPRGAITVKGKGEMQTYFLKGRRPRPEA
ncbi:MAG: adenylate/guanylate cyclase domain-containing protein [Myxococcales bacterium]|jgi:class 3 adenylate cyclase|nr:adenylate/guanylate cyclase domain-containing protein [Myxococcales bacterium]